MNLAMADKEDFRLAEAPGTCKCNNNLFKTDPSTVPHGLRASFRSAQQPMSNMYAIRPVPNPSFRVYRRSGGVTQLGQAAAMPSKHANVATPMKPEPKSDAPKLTDKTSAEDAKLAADAATAPSTGTAKQERKRHYTGGAARAWFPVVPVNGESESTNIDE